MQTYVYTSRDTNGFREITVHKIADDHAEYIGGKIIDIENEHFYNEHKIVNAIIHQVYGEEERAVFKV